MTLSRLGAALAAVLFSAGLLRASEPCSPNSWFAKKDRPSTEWAKLAKWIAVVKVTKRKEIIEPYPNCFLKDRSKCSMEDRSVLTVEVVRVEKGAARGLKTLNKGYCAPDPPKKAGETLRFYGEEPGSYIYFEKASR